MADPADPKQIHSAASIRDPLTGAYSRALLQERYQEEVDRARRYDMPCSVCLFDVDYFKSVNDAYGHTRGDHVLRELVQRLLGIIRSSDLLFRYGGDEFILLLPNTPKAEAIGLATRILEDIQTTPFDGTPALTLSLSIGVANFPEDAQTSEQLFETADRRNHAAKRQGRSRVVGDDTDQQHMLLSDDQSRLIERDDALDHLYRFLERLPSHRSGALGVAGLPGAGRTRFLAKVAEAARLRGYALVALTGAAATQHQPYGVLRGGVIADDSSADAEQITQSLLERARDHTGLIITVDNMRTIDRATINLLRHLLVTANTTVAIAYSIDLDRPRTLLHADAALAEVIELHLLSLNGLRIWLRSLLHWEAPAEFLSWLHQQTGGLPGAIQRGLVYLVHQGVLRSVAEREWTIRPDYSAIALGERLGLRATQPPHNLPVLLTDFVGREHEIEQVIALLDKHRIVTLLGPGGIGKTRLALQVAGELLHDFAQGVFFVPLATISDPALAAAGIAQIFAIKEVSGQRLIDSLKDYLRPKELLLILDNFEQIVDAAPLVSELLAAAPRLKILTTSREVLRISGEHSFPMPPLALPSHSESLRKHDSSPETLARYAAVALFAARAQAVQFDWALTSENAPIVAELCTRLDGLPLAIELAAARSNTLTPAEMLQHINNRLALLRDGPRDVPARQQTLRSAIDWSYALLAPAEQQLFTRLAVFAGSCSLEAIQAICALDAEPVQPADLQTLIEKSLLLQDQSLSAGPRYKMLETIREYALDQLTARGEIEALRRQHAAYYLALAEESEPRLSTADQQDWLQRLEDEHYNMQAALDWSFQGGDLTLAAQLSGALWRFWVMHSHISTGRRWYDTVLAHPIALPPRARAKVLLGSGTLAWLQGDYAQALAPLEESVTLFRAVEDWPTMAAALNNLGLVTREQGDYVRAQQCFAESLAVRQECGDRRGVAFTLGNLGRIAFYQGAIEQAISWNEESLALFRNVGDLWGIAVALFDLGEVVLHQRDLTRATALFEETLTRSQELGDKMLIAFALGGLGEVALEQGDPALAQRRFAESLTLQRDTGDKEGGATSIERLVALAVAQGQLVRAARLGGAAEALREMIGAPLPPIYDRAYQQTIATLRQQLEAAALASHWADGRALTLDQAIAEALSDT